MRYYQIYGLNVESDYELQGAYEIDKPNEIQVTISKAEIEEQYVELMPIEYEKEIGHGYVLHKEKWTCARFRGLAVFIIHDGNRIDYHLYEGYDRIRVNDLLADYCMGILAYQRNMLMIHGSGVYYKGATLIISGMSGAGKSSLADEMLARGYQLMADDIVAVDQENADLYAYPACPMRKLCADAVERKGLDKNALIPIQDIDREKYGILLKEEFYAQKAPLAAMVIIRKGNVETPVLEEVFGADKLKYLTANFIRKEIYNKVSYIKESFMKAVKVANSMPIYILTRPEEKVTVQQQADMIEEVLNKSR